MTKTPRNSDCDPVLQISNLKTYIQTRSGVVRAVDEVSFELQAGDTLGIVGESGCGKSMTALSVLGLVPRPQGIIDGSIRLNGRELVGLPEPEYRMLRGNQVSMIFQEPMTSLNPVMKIGRQIAEPLIFHRDMSQKQASATVIELLNLVRIPDARRRIDEYPHQLSGGMRQRVMIAMALACRPKVLIADEPTTALDVTIQAQILQLMRDIRNETGTAIMMITHDLGVIAQSVDRVIVMYAGRKVEEAPVKALFRHPRHPYTAGLLGSVPKIERNQVPAGRSHLTEIPGIVPTLDKKHRGCSFAPRCPLATQHCREEIPPFEKKVRGHFSACWHAGRTMEMGNA